MPDIPPGLRPITILDLASFPRPDIVGNRALGWRMAWYLVNAIIFRSAFLGLLPNKIKSVILRCFGAKIGVGLVCKPRVNIKYPWFLDIRDHVWIGEGVWIDNLCPVRIGNNVCISQGARLLTGSHDWNRSDFPFFARPIIIHDGVWVTAFRVIRPGVEIPAHMAVLSDLSPSAVRSQTAKI